LVEGFPVFLDADPYDREWFGMPEVSPVSDARSEKCVE
jgi:hypothetical protein